MRYLNSKLAISIYLLKEKSTRLLNHVTIKGFCDRVTQKDFFRPEIGRNSHSHVVKGP